MGDQTAISVVKKKIEGTITFQKKIATQIINKEAELAQLKTTQTEAAGRLVCAQELLDELENNVE